MFVVFVYSQATRARVFLLFTGSYNEAVERLQSMWNYLQTRPEGRLEFNDGWERPATPGRRDVHSFINAKWEEKNGQESEITFQES